MTPEQFREAYDLLPEASLMLTPSGVICAANASASKLLGSNPTELAGTSFDVFIEGSKEPFIRLLSMARRTHELLPGALSIKSRRGMTKFSAQAGLLAIGGDVALILLRLLAHSEANRQFAALNHRIETLAREIRSRRRAEADLFAQREWLQTTLASIGDAVIATDVDGRVSFMNAIAEDLTGWTAPEAIGKDVNSVFNVINEESRTRIEDPINQVIREGKVVGLANRTILVSRQGSERPVDDSGAPIRDRKGKLIGVVLVFRDVTERKRAEDTLRESERHFRNLADSAPVFIWISGPDKSVTFFNRFWLDFTGRTEKEELGYGWMQSIHPDDIRGCLSEYSKAFDARHIYRCEYRLRRHDGAYRWILDTGVPKFGSAGTFAGYVGSGLDITEHREAEERLKGLNEDLAQFAFVASHDLQEPLRTVATFTEMLENKYADQFDEGGREILSFISTNARRMRELVRDLLAFSRLVHEPEIDDLGTVDFQAVAEEVQTSLETSIKDTGALVRIDSLPVLMGRRSQIYQLFENLLSNALKYRDPARTPDIHIAASANQNHWLFRVTDNGIGIPPRYHEQIFGIFKRLHGQAYPGTGIGLAICRKIVEAHGGRIWVESRQGNGAAFLFTLPF